MVLGVIHAFHLKPLILIHHYKLLSLLPHSVRGGFVEYALTGIRPVFPRDHIRVLCFWLGPKCSSVGGTRFVPLLLVFLCS